MFVPIRQKIFHSQKYDQNWKWIDDITLIKLQWKATFTSKTVIHIQCSDS